MGESALSAAIRDRDGRAMAAVHIAGSLSEWQEQEFPDRSRRSPWKPPRTEPLRSLRLAIRAPAMSSHRAALHAFIRVLKLRCRKGIVWSRRERSPDCETEVHLCNATG